MATEKQIEANRKNALKAGVKTEEGKAKVRYNAFKHGLTGKVLLSNLESISESEEVYRDILQGLRDSFQPRNFYEESLVEAMANAQFKLGRYEHVEAGLFKDAGVFWGSSLYDDDPKKHLQMSHSAPFDLALKYKASLEAQFYRAVESLMKHREFQLDLFLPEQEKDL